MSKLQIRHVCPSTSLHKRFMALKYILSFERHLLPLTVDNLGRPSSIDPMITRPNPSPSSLTNDHLLPGIVYSCSHQLIINISEHTPPVLTLPSVQITKHSIMSDPKEAIPDPIFLICSLSKRKTLVALPFLTFPMKNRIAA